MFWCLVLVQLLVILRCKEAGASSPGMTDPVDGACLASLDTTNQLGIKHSYPPAVSAWDVV